MQSGQYRVGSKEFDNPLTILKLKTNSYDENNILNLIDDKAYLVISPSVEVSNTNSKLEKSEQEHIDT